MAEKRLYVGNLPNDTNDDDLKKIFKKYGASSIEIKQKPGAHENSTFAYVNIREDSVNNCLEQCQKKKVKNSLIKIEIAKESFLDRLKKEREKRNEKSSSVNAVSSHISTINVARKNKKIVFNDDGDDDNAAADCADLNFPTNNVITSGKKNAKKKRANINPESDSHSDDEALRKRKLPMFRGTASVSFAEETNSSCDFSMKRFEEFSEVWRDSSAEKEFPSSNSTKLKWKWNESRLNLTENEATTNSQTNKHDRKSKNVADNKRMNALKEKWNTMKEKKETIKKALKNLSSSRPKLKSFDSVVEKLDSVEKKEKKMVLFEDDAPDDDFEANFDVKEHSEDKNGLKLLKLKLKLSGDERFKLNDKFYEDVNDQQQDFDGQAKENPKHFLQNRTMIRYDPASADHQVIEKQPQSKKVLEKKKKTKKKPDKRQRTEKKSAEIETLKPEVSKETHYVVTDSLKEAFRKVDDKPSFSLSAMFDEKIRKETKTAEEQQLVATDEAVPIKKLSSIENPFENTSESETNDDEFNSVEDEELPVDVSLNPVVSSEKILGKCGVWGETFFFQPNDSRLQEAVNFYSVSNAKSKRMDFDKERCKLKSIVRKKLQNSRRDRKLFKQKLGGKLNKSKFQKRLKKARS